MAALAAFAEVVGTGTIESARNATPPRPSMFHGVATSFTTVTSCRFAIFGLSGCGDLDDLRARLIHRHELGHVQQFTGHRQLVELRASMDT